MNRFASYLAVAMLGVLAAGVGLVIAMVVTSCFRGPNVPGPCNEGFETKQVKCPDGRCCPTLESCCP